MLRALRRFIVHLLRDDEDPPSEHVAVDTKLEQHNPPTMVHPHMPYFQNWQYGAAFGHPHYVPHPSMLGHPMHGYQNPPLGYPPAVHTAANMQVAHTSVQVQPPAAPQSNSETTKEANASSASVLVQPASPVINDDEARDWPDGYVSRETLLGSQELGWNQNKWAWRSQGFSRGIETRVCLGVIVCSRSPTCTFRARPKTNDNARAEQAFLNCRVCKSPMVMVPCGNIEADPPSPAAWTRHFTLKNQSPPVKRWEHHGTHDHPRPPGGRLSKAQEAQIDQQVARRMDASAHSLRTGDTAPGSLPLPVIDPGLADAHRAHYQVAKSQARLGLSPAAPTKGGLAILSSFSDMVKEFEVPFILESSLSVPSYVMMQTPFMRDALEDAIVSWSTHDAQSAGPEAARHGCVTDGDHSFFTSGVLLVSVIFHPVLLAWVPILYTWIQGQDIPHHRPHFRVLMRYTMDLLKKHNIEFHSKFLTHIMDFSQSQRASHAEEYADARIYAFPAFQSLAPAAQKIQRMQYLTEAEEAEVGCDFHFSSSVEKVSAHIPTERRTYFKAETKKLLAKELSREDFDKKWQALRDEFTVLINWFTYWSRPTLASMTFPAVSKVNPLVLKEVPSTSNPVEHSHSLLHHATGKNHDLIPGIKNIYLHAREFEAQYRAVSEGHSNPPGPRENRPVRPREYERGDGRAPDTAATLEIKALSGSTTGTLTKVFQPAERFLASYKWNGTNSCFVDSTLEVLFRAFSLWDDALRTQFLSLVQQTSFMGKLSWRLSRRLMQMTDAKSSLVFFNSDLELMQSTILDFCLKEEIIEAPTRHGCCMAWLSKGLMYDNEAIEVQKHFGVFYQANYFCNDDHQHDVDAMSNPRVWYTLDKPTIAAAHTEFGNTVSIEQYFSIYVPLGDAVSGASTRPPVHRMRPRDCGHSGCELHSVVDGVQQYWPQTLFIVSDARADSDIYPDRIKFSNEFSVLGEGGEKINYTLVGRVLHHNSHFTSQLRIDGRTFTYDDMDGKLVVNSDHGLLEGPSPRAVFNAYHRTSACASTNHKRSTLEDRYTFIHNSKPLPPLPILDLTHSPSPTPPDALAGSVFNRNVQLDVYSPSPFTSCASCGLAERSYENHFLMTQCALCHSEWHNDCIDPKTIDDSQEGLYGVDDSWCCPACVNPIDGRWDQTMTGTVILLKPLPDARYYAAVILGRESTDKVHLQWYPGNIYDEGDSPIDESLILTPYACFNAYRRSHFEYSKETIGTIEWPLRFVEDAADHGYSNCEITRNLERAHGAILAILHGQIQHPIQELFISYYSSHSRPNNRASVLKQMEFDFAFTELFDLKCVRKGDDSLLNPFVVSLRHHTRDADMNPEHVRLVSSILLRLVIVRCYLRLTPSSDNELYWLSRRLTDAELASVQDNDPMRDAKLGTLRTFDTQAEQAFNISVPNSAGTPIITEMVPGMTRETMLHSKGLPAGSVLASAHTHDGSQYTFRNSKDVGLHSDIPWIAIPGSKSANLPPQVRLIATNYAPGHQETIKNGPDTSETRSKKRGRDIDEGTPLEPRRNKRRAAQKPDISYKY